MAIEIRVDTCRYFGVQQIDLQTVFDLPIVH